MPRRATDQGLYLETKQPSVFEKETEYSAVRSRSLCAGCRPSWKEDGLYFYRKIIEDSRDYLTPGGYLLFEIGYDQGLSVSELMRQAGYKEVTVYRDYAGLDRVVSGYRGILQSE